MAPDTRQRCPDEGACHHACVSACFRVLHCAPLRGAYPEGRWPAEVVENPRPRSQPET